MYRPAHESFTQTRTGEVTPRMGLVYFAFGTARVAPGEPLAGPILVRMLADLGLSEGASRSLLLRMRREGLLDSEPAGREARYCLTPIVQASHARLERQLRGDRPHWTGAFHGILYAIPERRRDYRDQLRRAAQYLGYVTLRPGLLIATTDRWSQLVSLVGRQPPGSQLLRTLITLSARDSSRVAAELWDLEALAGRYLTVLAEAQTRTAGAVINPPAPEATLSAFAAALLPVYETAAEDPDLPAALLPTGWPGDRVGATLNHAHRIYAPLLAAYFTLLHQRRSPPNKLPRPFRSSDAG